MKYYPVVLVYLYWSNKEIITICIMSIANKYTTLKSHILYIELDILNKGYDKHSSSSK